MSITLYYAPMTRAGRVRWLLEELGVPYELVRLDTAEKRHHTPEYLAIHPHGKVPALRDGDVTMFESAAIAWYLADKFADKGLAPPIGSPDRAAYCQWMIYAVSELEPTIAAVSYNTIMRPPEKRIPAAAEQGREAFRECARVLTAHLATREYMVANRFTAADVLIGGVLGWARASGLLEDQPALAAYGKRLAQREAFKRARAD